MDYEELNVEVDNRGVAYLTLNRPETHNALSALLIKELQYACDTLGQSDDIRVIVLTGSGKTFCAGGDLRWMKSNIGKPRPQRIEESSHLAKLLATLNKLPKPIIAKVNGPAYGGGVGLLCVCDYAISTADAKFAFTETRLGLVPATISPYVLKRIGEANARRNFLNARVFDAEQALKMELLAEVVDGDLLDEMVENEIKLMLKCGPAAVTAAKDLISHIVSHDLKTNEQYSTECLADIWETDEAKNGIDAFFNKTKPSWIK